MKKKIIIITGVFYPEPVVSANLMLQMATELAKSYDVTVLRPRPTRPKGFKLPEYNYNQFPFEVIETDSFSCPASSIRGRYKESVSMGEYCAQYIEKNKSEICFVYNGGWHLFGRKMVAEKCVSYGIPYITPVQDIYPESLIAKLPNIALLKWIIMKALLPNDRYTLTHAAKIHTISDKMVEQLSATRHLPKEKFVVVRNWQNEEDFMKYREEHPEDVENEKFTFMYLGNVGPLAGVDLLFDALRVSGLKDARLVVAGSGSAKDALMVKAKSYQDCHIEFWEVPLGEVPATQAKADVMCLPVKKGFAMSSIPSKLPAYMFSAKPVLASVDAGSDTAACVIEANAGWVASPEDVADVARCMKLAYNTSKQERKQMGQNGCDFAIQNISKKVNLPKLVNACMEVINIANR